MSFRKASIYAFISVIGLSALFYSDNVQAMVWIPSFFKQLLITVLLFPVFNWIYIVGRSGRRDPRHAEDGGRYGRFRTGLRITLSLFLIPLTLIASPPVLWGNLDSAWAWLGLPAFFLGLYGLALLWISRISWDTRNLTVTSPFHLGDNVFAWNTLAAIDYSRNAAYATLIFKDAGRAYVGHYIEGYADLMEHAESLIKDA